MLSPSPNLCPPAEGLQPRQAQPGTKGPRDTGWPSLLQRCFGGTKVCLLSLLKGNAFRSQGHQRGEVLSHEFVPPALVHWNILPSAGTAEMQTRWQPLGCTLKHRLNDIGISKKLKNKNPREKKSQSEFWDSNLSQLLLSYDGPWARMAGRCSLGQDDSSWTLIQSHHARKIMLHALSSSSATLHFRCRGMVYNLIPKNKGLVSIFYALLSSCLDFYDSTYIHRLFGCVQPSNSNIK